MAIMLWLFINARGERPPFYINFRFAIRDPLAAEWPARLKRVTDVGKAWNCTDILVHATTQKQGKTAETIISFNDSITWPKLRTQNPKLPPFLSSEAEFV